MCLVGENHGMHLTDFLLSCIQLRQPIDCVHFKTFWKTCFCRWGFQRAWTASPKTVRLPHSRVCRAGAPSVSVGGPPMSKPAAFFFFSRHLPMFSKRAGTPRPWAPASAALLAEGEKLPRISHGWLVAGRPTEPVECMRLSNVTSVGLVGKPRRRTTINLSHRH